MLSIFNTFLSASLKIQPKHTKQKPVWSSVYECSELLSTLQIRLVLSYSWQPSMPVWVVLVWFNDAGGYFTYLHYILWLKKTEN